MCFLAKCILLCCLAKVICYPNGPPRSACLTMFPVHGIDQTWQQSGPCPYRITLSSPFYRPRDNITITVKADDGTPIRGVQVSVHRKDINTEEFHGEFVYYSPQNKLQAMNCMGGRHNQIGHKNADRVKQLVLIWQAPVSNIGDLMIKLTFVKSFHTFWASQTQDLRTYDPNSVLPPVHIVETPSLDMADIDLSGCGQNKGCFLYPRLCWGSDCEAAITYTKHNNTFTIEMMAKSPGYVTMGLSKDKRMGDDHTITCTVQGDIATIQNGMNIGYVNYRVLVQNLTYISTKSSSGHVMCRFTRPYVVSVLTDVPNTDPPKVKYTDFDLREPWHIILAWGHVASGTDVISKHVELPVVSDDPVNFSDYTVHRGSFLSRQHQAHGALMVVAWIFLTGLSVVIARHYKHIGNGKLLLGAKIWFQAHRSLAVGALLLSAVSFVVIFIKIQGLAQSAGYVHARVGIAVGVAVLVQSLGGVLRPKPESNIRPLFRWGHRLLGKGTHLLAAVNMYLAFNMTYIHESMKRLGSVTILVWICIQVIWELIHEFWSCRRASKQDRINNSLITDSQGMDFHDVNPSPTNRVDTVLLALYCLTLSILALTTLCAIFFY